MPVNNVTPQELQDRQKARPSLVILDVRSPAEFESVHIPGAVNVPLSSLTNDLLDRYRTSASQGDLVFVCHSGGRSKKACDLATNAGFDEVHNLVGGTQAWEQAGLPVQRGSRKVISIDRQVRIIAGSIVAVGALLALTVSSGWAVLPLLVGLGLVFAGLTDLCGLALLLARMPWNQAGQGATQQCCSLSMNSK